MAARRTSYRGCLLGMAVGDAMGYTVDTRSWPEIQEDYGPDGLMGYDLVNGYAEISSHTQLAAFTCNGLLLGLTRGQMLGKMAPFIKYIELSAREWAASQLSQRRPEKTFCWLLSKREICQKSCVDTRMVDTLTREKTGSLEDPVNNFSTPGGLSAAIGVGLFFDRERLDQAEIDRLGAEAVAMTHGSPAAFLSGAYLAHLISRVLAHPNAPLKKLVMEAARSVRDQFGHQYSQAFSLAKLIRHAVTFAEMGELKPQEVMERLHCESAAQVLAGAVYACLVSNEDFDRAMVVAVNHSGSSAAVGAIVGAILGARLGETGLQEFYVECLKPADILRELADDLFDGCPMEMGSRLFDLDWDYKYLHGGK